MQHGFLLGLVALISSATTAAAGDVWYVDGSNTPPGTGTAEDPYSSIQYAVDRPTTQLGDTLRVAPGIYAESVDCGFKSLVFESVAGPAHTELRPATPNGFALRTGTTHLVLNTVRGFTIRGNGGTSVGLVVDFASTVVLERCLILDCGTAISLSYDVIMRQCAVVNNTAGLDAFSIDTFETLSNSIFWNNTASITGIGIDAASTEIDYCAGDVPTIYGVGNVVGDPLLWNVVAGDVHLQSMSPCIDTGDPTSPVDPDHTAADIGLYAYDPFWPYPAPVNYCTAVPNSSGVRASLSWSGSTAVPLNDFTLQVSGMPAFQTGIFIYSPDQAQMPLGNGNLCLGTTTQGFINRLPGGSANGLGVMTLHVDLTSPPIPMSTITPGSTWNFQSWFRDAVGSGFNFSDGLEVLFAP